MKPANNIYQRNLEWQRAENMRLEAERERDSEVIRYLAYALNECAYYSDHLEPLTKHADRINAAGKAKSGLS